MLASVPGQYTRVSKGLAALLAQERFLPRVLAQVNFEVAGIGVRHTAVVTPVGLVARVVVAHVNSQVGSTGERSGTHSAVEGSLTSVSQQVAHKLPRLSAAQTALFALVRFVTCVTAQMHFQMTRGHEACITHLTLERFVTTMGSLVFLQQDWGCEHSTAQPAFQHLEGTLLAFPRNPHCLDLQRMFYILSLANGTVSTGSICWRNWQRKISFLYSTLSIHNRVTLDGVWAVQMLF